MQRQTDRQTDRHMIHCNMCTHGTCNVKTCTQCILITPSQGRGRAARGRAGHQGSSAALPWPWVRGGCLPDTPHNSPLGQGSEGDEVTIML